ncbi:hypothetical protein LJR168_000410 [Pseudoxanthomonas sp. LjRoot168]|uniref:hypothetical protein n=1 Tax=unclassified Pseudoxanthomonas TaxID=2645906 RepID=UPI003ECD87B5
MGVILYNLMLVVFIIPVTLRAYLSLKNNRFPLPHFQNNLVVSRVKLRKAIGVLSPILFWGFHTLWLFWMIVLEAWLGVVATIVYMVVSALLAGQIRARQVHVVAEHAAAGSSAAEHD